MPACAGYMELHEVLDAVISTKVLSGGDPSLCRGIIDRAWASYGHRIRFYMQKIDKKTGRFNGYYLDVDRCRGYNKILSSLETRLQFDEEYRLGMNERCCMYCFTRWGSTYTYRSHIFTLIDHDLAGHVVFEVVYDPARMKYHLELRRTHERSATPAVLASIEVFPPAAPTFHVLYGDNPFVHSFRTRLYCTWAAVRRALQKKAPPFLAELEARGYQDIFYEPGKPAVKRLAEHFGELAKRRSV